jgi:hypothetical protein
METQTKHQPRVKLKGKSKEKFMSKPKKKTFSTVKAVKLNARTVVGSPPPERVLPDPKQKAAANPKHKKTLADLLTNTGEDE